MGSKPDAWIERTGRYARVDEPPPCVAEEFSPLFAIDDETREALTKAIRMIDAAAGLTHTCEECDKVTAVLSRLAGKE